MNEKFKPKPLSEMKVRQGSYEHSKLPDQLSSLLSSLLFIDDKNRAEHGYLALNVVAAIFLATLTTLLFFFPIKAVCRSLC
jgi:hypothetical protein